jgi:hypothetical protein
MCGRFLNLVRTLLRSGSPVAHAMTTHELAAAIPMGTDVMPSEPASPIHLNDVGRSLDHRSRSVRRDRMRRRNDRRQSERRSRKHPQVSQLIPPIDRRAQRRR